MITVAVVAGVLLALAPAANSSNGEFLRVPPDVAATAARAGTVRVIVKVDQPAGSPIDRAQDTVLGELASSSCRVLHRYLNSPFLALEVGIDALRVLDRSPHVISVVGDFEMRPLTPGTTTR